MRILTFGHDADLLLPESPDNEAQHRQRVYCRQLGQKRAFVILSRRKPASRNSLSGGDVLVRSAAAFPAAFMPFLAVLRGLALALSFRPDVVEYQDPALSGPSALIVARLLGLPLAGGVFNDRLTSRRWTAGGLMRLLAAGAGRFVLKRTLLARCDSAEETAALHRRGFFQTRCVPFYVPWLERFAPDPDALARRLRSRAEEPLVLCVARLEPEKNLPMLLRAFAAARKRVGRGRLVLVGSGSLEGELRRLASELGLDPWLERTGSIPYTALPEQYAKAHLLALSSDSETSARVLVLARAAGLPVVTTATPGSAEIVAHARTGLITPVGDEPAFADALARLLGDDGFYARLLEGALAAAASGEEAAPRELRDFYEELGRLSPPQDRRRP